MSDTGTSIVAALLTGGLALAAAVSVAGLSQGNGQRRWRAALLEWEQLREKLDDGSPAKERLGKFIEDTTLTIVERSEVVLRGDNRRFPWFAERPLVTSWIAVSLVSTGALLYMLMVKPELPLWAALVGGIALGAASTLLAWMMTASSGRSVDAIVATADRSTERGA